MDELTQKLTEQFATTHTVQFEITGAGMSRVFVAEEKALSRKVVIKVLSPQLAAAVSIERFQREIMVLAGLNHPNVVPVLSAGQIGNLPYFIMPFVSGESLRVRMARGPLSIRETVGVLRDVTRALAYAHAAGIVHRDIKPDNIMLTGSAAVVTDFGVAKAVSASRNRFAAEGQAITGVGISLGTPQYMAPEQAAADPKADHRVDLYAIGIVGYEMLLGSPPFFGRTPQGVLAAQLTELPAPLAARRYDIPVALADVIMKCLEKDPNDRPRNALEVQRVLESGDAVGGPVAARPETVARQTRERNVRRLWSIGALGALAALATWSVWPEPATPPITTAAPAAVRIVRSATTADSALILPFLNAIEATLVQNGVQVFSGASPDASGQSVYVVETTVQRVGSRARVNVRLVDPDPTTAVWATQLDFATDSVFAAQDQIALRVSDAVARAQSRRQP
ncbi:MAG TPA: serine/threonine-protein kinase [Gemmatimonadaceae bacterium]